MKKIRFGVIAAIGIGLTSSVLAGYGDSYDNWVDYCYQQNSYPGSWCRERVGVKQYCTDGGYDPCVSYACSWDDWQNCTP